MQTLSATPPLLNRTTDPTVNAMVQRGESHETIILALVREKRELQKRRAAKPTLILGHEVTEDPRLNLDPRQAAKLDE